MRDNYAALSRGDIRALLELSDPGVTVYQSELLPWGGRRSGHEGLLDFLSTVRANLDSVVTPDELFTAGDRVVQVGRTRGTAISTGKAFDAAEVHLWQVRHGLITGFEAYVDTDELLRALSPER